MPMAKNYVSTLEAARVLGVSRVAMLKRITTGKVKAERVGGSFIIPLDEVRKQLGKGHKLSKRYSR